jgi:hypothetical protein
MGYDITISKRKVRDEYDDSEKKVIMRIHIQVMMIMMMIMEKILWQIYI